MSKPEFVYTIYIQTTPEKVWEALKNPEMTKEFWGRRRNASDWAEGASWRHENYDDPDKISKVTFAIDEFMDAVRLTVTHTDLTEEGLRGISAGWPAVLSSLKSLLESGSAMPMTTKLWKRAG